MHTIEQTTIPGVVFEEMSHFLRDFIGQPAFAILNCNGTYAIVSQQFHRFHSYKDIGASFNLDGGILKVESFIWRIDRNPGKLAIVSNKFEKNLSKGYLAKCVPSLVTKG